MDYIKTLFNYNFQKYLSVQRVFAYSPFWFIGSILSIFLPIREHITLDMVYLLFIGGLILLFAILPRYHEYNAACIICLNALLARDIRYSLTQSMNKHLDRNELVKKVVDALATIRRVSPSTNPPRANPNLLTMLWDIIINLKNRIFAVPTLSTITKDVEDAIDFLLMIEPYVKLEAKEKQREVDAVKRDVPI